MSIVDEYVTEGDNALVLGDAPHRNGVLPGQSPHCLPGDLEIPLYSLTEQEVPAVVIPGLSSGSLEDERCSVPDIF